MVFLQIKMASVLAALFGIRHIGCIYVVCENRVQGIKLVFRIGVYGHVIEEPDERVHGCLGAL